MVHTAHHMCRLRCMHGGHDLCHIVLSSISAVCSHICLSGLVLSSYHTDTSASIGRLMGTFSGTDLRGLFQEKFPSLLKPVLDFIREQHPQSLSCVTVPATAPLLDVVRLMAASRVHRVWMVNDSFEPIGVISMTDVLSAVHQDLFYPAPAARRPSMSS